MQVFWRKKIGDFWIIFTRYGLDPLAQNNGGLYALATKT